MVCCRFNSSCYCFHCVFSLLLFFLLPSMPCFLWFVLSFSITYPFYNTRQLRTPGTADNATMGHAVLHAPVGFCFHSRSAEGIGFGLRNMPVRLLRLFCISTCYCLKPNATSQCTTTIALYYLIPHGGVPSAKRRYIYQVLCSLSTGLTVKSIIGSMS